LACPINVGAIGKIYGDVSESVFGHSTQHGLFGNAEHFDFNRRGNPRFNFFWR